MIHQPVELDEHQLIAIDSCQSGRILRGDVGSGKSRTILAYYFLRIGEGSVCTNGIGDYSPMKNKVPLYIITTARKRNDHEWEEEVAYWPIDSTVVIDSWNNITKYQDITDAFFILDEQRLVGNGAWVKAFYEIARKNQWMVLTATPGDVWMDYIPVFVANGLYKNRTEFLNNHVVWSSFHTNYPKVSHYVNIKKLNRNRKHVLIEMEFARDTSRIHRWVECEYDQLEFDRVYKDRWNVFDEEPIENISRLWYTMRRVVNSDPSRLNALAEIHEDHKRVIVFYNFTYEVDRIRSFVEQRMPGVEFAEYNGKRHDPTPTSSSWVYAVQYMAGAEAWNCITTDCIVFSSLTYSYKMFEQAQGRIDRMNTPYDKLYYYILYSDSFVDRAIKKSLDEKTEFNERKVKL